MTDILVVCPQERDLRAIESAGLSKRYRIRYAGSDLYLLNAFDPVSFMEDWQATPSDGIVASKDQSAPAPAANATGR